MSTIYTDGSCLKNPGGASGWAYCTLSGDHLTIGSGGEVPQPQNTNNRMELQAIIEALKTLKGVQCHIFTDSQWALKGATGVNKRHLNLDLWGIYDKVATGKNITYTWVKAHCGDTLNEFVDDLARGEAEIAKCKKINVVSR